MDKTPFPFHVGFVPSKEAWDLLIKDDIIKADQSYPDNDAMCCFFPGDPGHNDFCLVTVNAHDHYRGLLIHEAVHCFQRMAYSIGEERPGEEFEAYMIQFISGFLLWAYEETSSDPANKKASKEVQSRAGSGVSRKRRGDREQGSPE